MTPNNDVNNALFIFIPFLIISSGVALLYMFSRARLREREMLHRERLAMIEKGLLPAPDADPARFEQLAGPAAQRMGQRESRYRSGGIVLMGLGVAMWVLLSFTAGVPEVGLGLGGALAALGIAFFVIGTMQAGER